MEAELTGLEGGGVAAAPDANPLVALLAGCIVRIEGDGRFAGTGFFVAPGEVLTCAHVVHGCAEVTVGWEGSGCAATVTAALPELAVGAPEARFYPQPDVALLRLVDPPSGHPCVRLEVAEPAADPPDVLRAAAWASGEHAPGVVARTSLTTEYEGPVQEQGWRLLKLKRGQVVRGFSGAALLNTRTGGVCGLVDSTRDERSYLGGFGVPLAAFLDQLAGLRERSAAHRAAWNRADEDERRLAAERAGNWDRLPLDRPRAALDWDPDGSRADLLRPRYGVVPFVGRQDLLDQVMLWREGADRLGVVVLVGAGGLGKTRTAVEACAAGRRAGWSTGLVAVEDTARPGEELDALAGWPGRLLVALDYAETRPDLVAGLLRRLLRRPDRPPARVVLIVRQAVTRRRVEALFAVGAAREELAGVLARAEVVRLDSDEHELDRRELFERACAAFGGLLGRSGVAGQAPALRAEHFARPLFVLAAALVAVEDDGVDFDRLSADELLAEVLDRHEAGHWDRWNGRLRAGLHPDDQRRAVALAALLGAHTEDEAAGVVRLLPGFAGSDGERVRAIARWLARLYGQGRLDGRPAVAPLEPDLLAEVLIARELTAKPELIGAALDAASDGQLARALVMLSRAAAGRDQLAAAVRAALDERLPGLVRRLVRADQPEELAVALRLAVASVRPLTRAPAAMAELPEASTVLAPLAADITALAVAAYRTLAERDPDRFLPDLATSLNNLSNRLSDLGRPEQALAAIQEAVTAYRQLAATRPDRFLPDLATLLNNSPPRGCGSGSR